MIDNTIKQGRIAKELERIYGIVDMKRPAKVQAKKELAQTLDCSYERMETYKRMADMNDDIQQAVLSGKIQPTVAAVELSRMTEGEQEQFAQLIPQKAEWSNAEVKEQARLIKKLRQENKDLEERLERAVTNSDDDEADIEEFIQRIAELEQECRKEYERADRDVAGEVMNKLNLSELQLRDEYEKHEKTKVQLRNIAPENFELKDQK